MKVSWINKGSRQVLLHIVIWVIVFSLPYLLRYPDNNMRREPDGNGFFYVNNITGLLWVIIFYMNAFVFTPKLIYTKKYLLYTVLLLLIFTVAMLVHGMFFRYFITSRPFNFLRSASFNLAPFVLTLAVSMAWRTMADRSKTEKLLLQQHEETLKTELSFLRSQVSPHFMFNVLNNMLALSRIKSDQLEPTIFKLSSLMRYMLYEADEEKVLLKKEADYLQSYIDLQKQRLSSKVKLNINLDVPDAAYEIAPMLLIPFIENTFKHGAGYMENPCIDIDLDVKNDTLHLTVRNTYNEKTAEIKDKTSGIGLANVKRRLNLLYDKKHQLNISKKDGWFVVSLQINLT